MYALCPVPYTLPYALRPSLFTLHSSLFKLVLVLEYCTEEVF